MRTAPLRIKPLQSTLAFCGAFICLYPIATQANDAKVVGTVLSTHGKVVAIDKSIHGKSRTRKLTRRSKVFANEFIQTNSGSSAQVRFTSDKNIYVAIGHNKDFNVNAYVQHNSDLKAGKNLGAAVVKTALHRVSALAGSHQLDHQKANRRDLDAIGLR